MTRSKTFRPRVSREHRDRVVELAERVNGGPVEHGYQNALELLIRYFDVLTDELKECPNCGTEGQVTREHRLPSGEWHERPPGNYWCKSCESAFSAWDYLKVEDREGAEFLTPGDVERTFVFEEEGEQGSQAGTKHTDSRSNVQESKGRDRW
jgi:hypothetical protein